jgi:hypothetical protein
MQFIVFLGYGDPRGQYLGVIGSGYFVLMLQGLVFALD